MILFYVISSYLVFPHLILSYLISSYFILSHILILSGVESEVAGSPFEILLATSQNDVVKWKDVLKHSRISRLEEFQ